MTSTTSSDLHRVGAGLAVRFTAKPVDGTILLDVEWTPRVPTKRELKRVLPRYRVGRDQFLAELAAETGLSITCIEA